MVVRWAGRAGESTTHAPSHVLAADCVAGHPVKVLFLTSRYRIRNVKGKNINIIASVLWIPFVFEKQFCLFVERPILVQ